jgi:hypothetical protein
LRRAVIVIVIVIVIVSRRRRAASITASREVDPAARTVGARSADI